MFRISIPQATLDCILQPNFRRNLVRATVAKGAKCIPKEKPIGRREMQPGKLCSLPIHHRGKQYYYKRNLVEVNDKTGLQFIQYSVCHSLQERHFTDVHVMIFRRSYSDTS